MQIVVLDGYTLNPGDLSWQAFADIGEVTVYGHTDRADIISRIGGAEIVMTNKTPITEETLAACPNIRYIGVLATGYNVIDLDACTAYGIPVANVPDYGGIAVGQFAIGLLLELCQHTCARRQDVRAGKWQADLAYWPEWTRDMQELAGKTMGIIGLGNIGYHTANIAGALGMKVLGYARRPNDRGRSVATYVSLEELLAKSDVISLHCPLTPETTGIINKDTIAQMKDGVIILNTSRGPLIVEEDLYVGLTSGKIRAVGLDVTAKEPPAADHPLLGLENCIITPHIAWGPKEARGRLVEMAADNLRAFLANAPQNVLNPAYVEAHA